MQTPARTKQSIITTLHQNRSHLREFGVRRIGLFGSFVRGEQHPDSDIDLLVVMPVPGSKRRLAEEIDLALAGVGMPKDVIVVTPEEVEKYREIVGTIIYPAVHEGKVLYERVA